MQSFSQQASAPVLEIDFDLISFNCPALNPCFLRKKPLKSFPVVKVPLSTLVGLLHAVILAACECRAITKCLVVNSPFCSFLLVLPGASSHLVLTAGEGLS
jgi:hypothetical protein